MAGLGRRPPPVRQANRTPERYREVSVADVDVPLSAAALAGLLVGREAYRRTRYLVVRRSSAVALLEVEVAAREPLFSPITGIRMLAEPQACRWVQAPEIDTAVPSQLARVARAAAPDARAVIVQGRYEHVSFILDPAPLRVWVVEVVPPEPAKLADQAQRVLDLAEDLPPVELVPVTVDLRDLARSQPADRYLYACRGGGARMPGARVDYLDQRPPDGDWVQVGCARSRQIHQWFYGRDAPCVDACPLARVEPDRLTLTKCCLRETGVGVEGPVVTVPWGASLREVRTGLARVVEHARHGESPWAPA